MKRGREINEEKQELINVHDNSSEDEQELINVQGNGPENEYEEDSNSDYESESESDQQKPLAYSLIVKSNYDNPLSKELDEEIFSLDDGIDQIKLYNDYDELLNINIIGNHKKGKVGSITISFYLLKSLLNEQFKTDSKLSSEVNYKIQKLINYLREFEDIALDIRCYEYNDALAKFFVALNIFLLSIEGKQFVHALNFEGFINDIFLELFINHLKRENISLFSISLKDSQNLENKIFTEVKFRSFIDAVKESRLLGLELDFGKTINIESGEILKELSNHPTLLTLKISIFNNLLEIETNQLNAFVIDFTGFNYSAGKKETFLQLFKNPFIKQIWLNLKDIPEDTMPLLLDSKRLMLEENEINLKQFSDETNEFYRKKSINLENEFTKIDFIYEKFDQLKKNNFQFKTINLKEIFFNKNDILFFISSQLSRAFEGFYTCWHAELEAIIPLLKYYNENCLLLNGITKSPILYTSNDENSPRVELSLNITQIIIGYIGLNSINSGIYR